MQLVGFLGFGTDLEVLTNLRETMVDLKETSTDRPKSQQDHQRFGRAALRRETYGNGGAARSVQRLKLQIDGFECNVIEVSDHESL